MSKIILIFILSLWCSISNAVNIDREYANSLNYAKGLAGETVRNMNVDHQGQVWMATGVGLTVFNGVRSHSYRFYSDKKRCNAKVFDVCEGLGKSIFVGTSEGVYELKFGSDNFVNVLSNLGNVENLFADGNTLYIGSTEGFFLYDGKTIKKINMGKRTKLDYLPRHFVKDKEGKIWFDTRYSLCCYNPKTGKLVSKQITLQMPYNSFLAKFAIYGDKVFVGTTSNGLFSMNMQTGKLHNVEGVGDVTGSIEVVDGNRLYVTTRCDGVFVLDADTEKVLWHYGIMEKGEYLLPTNCVESFLRVGNGVNWFGVSRYGAVYSYYNSHLFDTYSYGTFSTRNMDIYGFLKHGSERIIGLQNGFWYVNEQSGVTKFISSLEMSEAHLLSKFAFFNGKYYVGANDGGLRIFDPQTLEVANQSYHPLLSRCSVTELKVAPNGKLFVGTNEGLFVIDKTGKCIRYAEQNSRICGGAIRGIVFDHSDNIWIASSSELCIYLANSNDFENSCFPKGFFNKNVLSKLIMGHQQKIFAVSNGRILETNEKMTQFGELDVPQGIMDDGYRFFIDDMRGHYWVASEKGLFSLDYSLKEISYFGNSDGIRGSYVNDAMVDEDGFLWVCTSEGLSYVSLDKVSHWHKASPSYKLLVYDIRRGDEEVGYGEEGVINDEASITIRWNMVSSPLFLKATLPNYAKTEGRFYEYKVDGDKKWRLVSEGNEIILTKLLLGTHDLKIRLMGAENTERTFKILVVPSVAAILEILFFVVSIVLLFLWRRYRKNTHTLLSERNQIEDTLIEMEQKQEETMEAQEVSEVEYQKVKVSEEESQIILKKMEDYMVHEHAYRNPDLKRSDIAEAIGTSVVKLSLVLNQQLNKSYYAYVNHFRLEEFKRLIDEGEYKRYTVTALSEQCGFKRTSFFSTFRKVEGMTPAEYLKTKNIRTTL